MKNMKEYEDEIEKQLLMESAPGAFTKFNGKTYSYFGGTSYYELHKNELVIKSAIDALKQYGISSSSSRSSYGTTQLIIDVEKEAAEYFQCEDAVYLASGYLTDQAAIQALDNYNSFDLIFIDENSHYSNEYASRLSGKPVYTFAHLNSRELEEKVLRMCSGNQKPLIITDGVFPIFGSIAPINNYVEIAEKYNGLVWIDDAHSIGILGDYGKGTVEHYNLVSDRVLYGGTFSKAFGGYGGIIPGKKSFIQEIKTNQIYTGSTPVPSAAAAASLTGIRIIKSNPNLKIQLWQNAHRLKNGLRNIGIDVTNSNVPIVAWKLNNKLDMEKLHKELMKKGILIQFINYVGSGNNGALRIVVFSTHSNEQIDNLIYELKKII